MGVLNTVKDLVLDFAASGQEFLRQWYPKVEQNFRSLLSWFVAHVNGEADRHTAADVDYNSTQTVKAKIDAETSARVSAVGTVNARIEREENARSDGNAALEAKIETEAEARSSGDNELQQQINRDVLKKKVFPVLEKDFLQYNYV